MKSKNILLSFLLLSIINSLIYSCKKKDTDTTKPVISLNGDANMTISKGTVVNDPGATAIDDVDGDLSGLVTSNWSEKVKFNETGTYEVTYSVTNKKGNKATATRKVTVKFGTSSLFGEYDSVITFTSGPTGVFTSTVTAGDNDNQINIFPFYGADLNLKVNIGGVFGDELTFSQTGATSTVVGNGAIKDGGKTIVLTYTHTYSGADHVSTETLNRK